MRCPANSFQLLIASGLTQKVRLPRCSSAALYSRQLRIRYVFFLFFTYRNYHVAVSATNFRIRATTPVICGEFPEFGTAYYHSAVNYTTLGYGDVIMTPSWRLLGPLEAANGALMFGVSTAIIFAVMQRLIEARFVDLRD